MRGFQTIRILQGKRKGRRSGIDFFKHQAKTTNWVTENKYYFCEQRNKDENVLEVFHVVFFSPYLSTAFISVVLNALFFT